MANGKLSYKDNRLKRYKSMTLGIPPQKKLLKWVHMYLKYHKQIDDFGNSKEKNILKSDSRRYCKHHMARASLNLVRFHYTK